MHKVIDLFAGAGGLSLGFKKTGKYEIAAAFEINQNAQKTYKKNHPGTEVFSDVCSADFKKLRRKLGKIDVVIGGPPCQGFSMANRQKNHVISQNNMLVSCLTVLCFAGDSIFLSEEYRTVILTLANI